MYNHKVLHIFWQSNQNLANIYEYFWHLWNPTKIPRFFSYAMWKNSGVKNVSCVFFLLNKIRLCSTYWRIGYPEFSQKMGWTKIFFIFCQIAFIFDDFFAMFRSAFNALNFVKSLKCQKFDKKWRKSLLNLPSKTRKTQVLGTRTIPYSGPEN